MVAKVDMLRSQIRESQIFVSDIRKRLDKFVDDNDRQAEDSAEGNISEALREQGSFYESFVRENRSDQGNIWSWHTASMVFEVNEEMLSSEIHWHFNLRNSLIAEVASDTHEWRAYLHYIKSLQLNCEESKLPVIKRKLLEIDREIARLAAEKDEKARLEEEEKAKKGNKGKTEPKKVDPKKGGDRKKEIEKQLSLVVDPQAKLEESQIVHKIEMGRKRPKMNKDQENWRLFEIANKQVSSLPTEAITPAVYLEAFCHEIETRLEGDVQPHLEDEEREQEDELKQFLDNVFDSILESK